MPAISNLPYELFVLILDLSMPPIDILGLHEVDTCHEFVKFLNALGSVCRGWRDVVHSTASFWKVVCVTFPMTLNSVILSRSRECQVFIHYQGSKVAGDIESQNFLQLTEEHRHRWVAVVLEASSGDIASLLLNHITSPAPLLQSIKLSITHLERTLEPMTLLGSQTQNLRNFQLRSISIQWPSHTLTNLKTLVLSNILENAPTTQHLLDILSCSPALEILELDWIMIIPSPINNPFPCIRLPYLRCFRLRWISAEVVDILLQSLSVTAGVITQFNIAISANDPVVDWDRYFSETLSPFVQVYKHLNTSCVDQSSSLSHHGFAWRAFPRSSERFSLVIPRAQFSTGLRWLENVIGIGDPGVMASLYLRGGVPGPLAALERSRVLSKLALNIMSGVECVEPVFNSLEGSGSGDGTDPMSDSLPAFPALHRLRLFNWSWDISRVEHMLLRRFSKRRTMGLSFPDLQIEFDSVGYHPDRIIPLETANQIRRMEGVKVLRLGSRMKPGCLAVVWCEELWQPVWG